MALAEKEEVEKSLLSELESVKAALEASVKSGDDFRQEIANIRADFAATSTALQVANEKLLAIESEKASAAPATSSGPDSSSLGEPSPDNSKSASDSRRRNLRDKWPRALSSAASTSQSTAGGAGRLPLDRYLDILMASPDPDPSYILDEAEIEFAKKVLAEAIAGRKAKLQYQRRHEGRYMDFEGLMLFRDDMRLKAVYH